MGQESALDHRDILEVSRHTVFGQHFFHEGKIAGRTLQPQDDLRPVPEDEKHFLFKPLAHLRIFKGNRLTAEKERFLEPDG